MGAYENQGPCRSDLNGDTLVDGTDLGILLSQWNDTCPCTADINGDNDVNGNDLGILLSDWSIPADSPGCIDVDEGGGGNGLMASFGETDWDWQIDGETAEWLVGADVAQLWTWYLDMVIDHSGGTQ